MDEKLFPEVPEDLAAADAADLRALEKDLRAGISLIQSNDEEFLGGREGSEVLSALRYGVEGLEKIVAELDGRALTEEADVKEREELLQRFEAVPEKEEVEETESTPEVKAEDEPEPAPDPGSEEEDGAVTEERELVTASAEKPAPPAPAPDRIVVNEPKTLSLVATVATRASTPGEEIDRIKFAEAVVEHARNVSQPSHGRTRSLVARIDYRDNFPPERTLSGDVESNSEKIKKVVPASFGLGEYRESLTADGNVLCAPLTPIYSMPQFASMARPVRDALPSFRADRGGVNVPAATYIGDITTAISLIDQADEEAGGTYNTKSCQDMTCPAYTETAITTIAHCRQYGNLNARAWPEKIAHENELTMAAQARVAEDYLLDRIKAQSVNVTNGATTLGSLIYVVDAIVRSKFGIMGRLRMDRGSTFRALIPFWVPEMLALDTVSTPNEGRFSSEDDLVAYLRGYGIEPAFYLDTPTSGNSQLPDSSQTEDAIDALPSTVQWAIFPEGAFLHVDGGELELGIVRDSTLNETNEFQVFGESFENVALIGPAQSAYWVTTTYCASGEFPPAGTARTCP